MVNAVNAVERRKKRNRYAVKRSAAGRNRLVVHRTNQHIYAQLIDDSKGVVVAQASTLDKELASALKAKSNIDAAKKVGSLIAKRAKDKKVTEIVFDRGPYLYHGRIKALAEAAREGGLKF